MQNNISEASWALCAQSLPPHHAAEIAELVRTKGDFASALAVHADGALIKDGLARAERTLEQCRKLSISVIPLSSPRYPTLVKVSPGAPLVLFVRSRQADFHFPESSLAIVGSRAASIDVCSLAFEFARAFAQAGVTVVSGLALGVDGAAHRGALAGGGDPSTIAVLAHGLDTLYPASHEPLAERILTNGGALISEYPPGAKPLKHHFLERNRIVATLSRGVVVVQAGARSGSLVTARFAAESGRDVFVVEGKDSNDFRFEGSDKLIADGARRVSDPEVILSEYGIGSSSTSDDFVMIPMTELVSAGVLSQGALARLEVEGRADRYPGGMIRMTQVTFAEILAAARTALGKDQASDS